MYRTTQIQYLKFPSGRVTCQTPSGRGLIIMLKVSYWNIKICTYCSITNYLWGSVAWPNLVTWLDISRAHFLGNVRKGCFIRSPKTVVLRPPPPVCSLSTKNRRGGLKSIPPSELDLRRLKLLFNSLYLWRIYWYLSSGTFLCHIESSPVHNLRPFSWEKCLHKSIRCALLPSPQI